MASIKLTPDEFADVVVAFLLDSMMKSDDVLPESHEFHYIVKKMEMGGMKAHLLSYFLDTSSITRGKYKVLRKSFVDKGQQNNILITADLAKDDKYDDKITIKNIVKQTLRLIKSHKMRKNNGMPLNEETVDKIIDKVMEKYNG